MGIVTEEGLKRVGCLGRGASVYAPFSVERDTEVSDSLIFQNVSIGKGSYINRGVIRSNTTVGRFCSIGRNVTLAAGDHPLDGLTTHPIAWKSAVRPRRPADTLRSPKRAFTEIGHDVWIGDNVVVMAGVSIGTGAVLGANAVVTKDVMPYSIVGGVPAKLIRMRFRECIVDKLLASEWWTLPTDALLQLNMNDVDDCIARIEFLRAVHGVDKPHHFQFD